MKTYDWIVDEFDSKIFKLKIAKIIKVNSASITTLLKNLKNNSVEYAVIRVESDNFQLIHSLEEHGFYLVDGYLQMECELSKPVIRVENIFEAKIRDLDQLREIASTSFKRTRFYNDNFLPKANAGKIYEQWIENSVKKKVANQVFIYKEANQIAGFITLKNDGHIPLIAVRDSLQGRGIGKNLIIAGLNELSKWNCKKATIESQMQNMAALRIYQACGFKIIDSYITLAYHTKKF